jgi:hypothetical protein
VVEFLDTVRVSLVCLCGVEFGERHLLDCGSRGGQFEHGCFAEVAAVAGFPFVVLLDEDCGV